MGDAERKVWGEERQLVQREGTGGSRKAPHIPRSPDVAEKGAQPRTCRHVSAQGWREGAAAALACKAARFLPGSPPGPRRGPSGKSSIRPLFPEFQRLAPGGTGCRRAERRKGARQLQCPTSGRSASWLQSLSGRRDSGGCCCCCCCCWALATCDTSSSHRSASEGVRLCPGWKAAAGGTEGSPQAEVPGERRGTGEGARASAEEPQAGNWHGVGIRAQTLEPDRLPLNPSSAPP